MDEKELIQKSQVEETPKKKTTKKTSTKKTVEKDVAEETASTETSTLKQELEDMKKALAEAQAMNQQMAQMMAMFQSGMNAQQVMSAKNTDPNERIKIQFNMRTGIALKNSNKQKIVQFSKDGEVATITAMQYEQIKSNPENVGLFRKGYITFVGESEKYYEIEGWMKPQFIPTLDNIAMLYVSNDLTTVNRLLTEVINGDMILGGEIYWKSVQLVAEGRLNFSAQNIISNYWHRDISVAVNNYLCTKAIGFAK